jgi:DNA topoisomerase IB
LDNKKVIGENMYKHFAQICNEFLKIATPWWSGQTFMHPETKHRVKFKSLPIEEQKRLNDLHKKTTQKLDDKSKLRSMKEEMKQKRKQDREEEKVQKLKNIKPETHPNFFTDDGTRLDTTHGIRTGFKVVKNPEWNAKKDDNFYALDVNPKTNRQTYYYTENYMKKHKKVKFANVKRFMELLSGIREKYMKDLKSSESRRRTYSTAIALVDKCAMRVGNKKSEQNDVRGLHNLEVKHMDISGNQISLHYTGKDKVEQHHKFIVDDTIKNNLLDLVKDKGPEDSIFTFEKLGRVKRITPRFVNRYLKNDLGSNVTVHKFRHANGTRIAKEYLDGIDTNKMTTNDVKLVMSDAISKVADFLGNTPVAAKKHYIDTTIFEDFLKKGNFKVKLKDVLKGVASSSNMKKTASDSSFVFSATSTNSSLTSEEKKFADDINEIKLEELQPYEDLESID